MNISDFLKKKDEFLTFIDVERNLTENTTRAYEGDLQQFSTFWETIQKNEINKIQIKQAIERFFVSLFHKKISKSSIARKLSCLKSFERYLLGDGINLNLNLKRPRVEKKLPEFLTVDEMFHLLDDVKDEELDSKYPARDKAILELLYATGIRCSELVGIKIKNIDFEEKTIRIYGKGRKERISLFGNKAKEKLHTYITKERTTINSTDEYLFLNHRNQQLTSRSVQRIIQIFRKFLLQPVPSNIFFFPHHHLLP